MRCLLAILLAVVGVLNAAPPGKHEVQITHPESMPMPAPLNVKARVPDVVVPALQEALVFDHYGTTGRKLVSVAKQYLGCRYVLGSCGPKSFDCSGLVRWVYALEGIELARSSRGQYCEGIEVGRADLRAGDLVFFAHQRSSNTIYHVGMVVDADGEGGFRFIHSVRSGVRVSSSDEQVYMCDYYGARRILADAVDVAALMSEAESDVSAVE